MTGSESHYGDMLHRTSVNDGYGIDEEGPIPELQTNNHVVVPRSEVQLDQAACWSMQAA